MNSLVILCVEDEVEVRDAIVRDIEPFGGICRIEEAQDAADARSAVKECLDAGEQIALVLCDHLLPGESGVDFLVSLERDERTRPTRKVLVTGQAGLEDTVKAINDAGLHHYIAKPWQREQLVTIVRSLLTDYVIDKVDDVLPYVSVLDGPRLLGALKGHNRHD